MISLLPRGKARHSACFSSIAAQQILAACHLEEREFIAIAGAILIRVPHSTRKLCYDITPKRDMQADLRAAYSGAMLSDIGSDR
jgi:hypothetical protein